jgi:small-conductance mechanosensitive channel
MEGLLESIPYSTPLIKISALIVLLLIMKLIMKCLRLFLRYFIVKNKSRYHIQDLSTLACGLIFILVFVILFASEFKEFAIPFSVIGAGIAFSLQEVIASMAGRIIIVLTSLYQVGDRIQIGEIQGDVINIGFMRTSLMEIGNWVKADQYSGRIVHVTNAIVLKDNVVNYSGTFPFVWDEIVVPVRYGSDQHLARKILLSITRQHVEEHILVAADKWKNVKEEYMVGTPNFEPAVALVANDNWLEFSLRYIVPYESRRNTKDKLFLNIVDAFGKTDGKVEFASMTIEITNLPKLDVCIGK